MLSRGAPQIGRKFAPVQTSRPSVGQEYLRAAMDRFSAARKERQQDKPDAADAKVRRPCSRIFACEPAGKNRSICCESGDASCRGGTRAMGPNSSKLSGRPICAFLASYSPPGRDSQKEGARRVSGRVTALWRKLRVGAEIPSSLSRPIRTACQGGIISSPKGDAVDTVCISIKDNRAIVGASGMRLSPNACQTASQVLASSIVVSDVRVTTYRQSVKLGGDSTVSARSARWE